MSEYHKLKAIFYIAESTEKQKTKGKADEDYI